MPDFNEGSECPQGKVCYEDETAAQAALDEIIKRRLDEVSDHPPERQVYKCSFCEFWHLSSRPPEMEEEEPPRIDGETWESYAHRLEARIKAQRQHIGSLNQLRLDAGNRINRKKLDKALTLLGRERVLNHDLSEMNKALVALLKEHGVDRSHHKKAS